MEQTKATTWLLLISGIVAVVLLAAAPLGYKFGVFALMPSFASLMLALGIAVLVLPAALVMAILAARKGLARNRNLLIAALVISLVPPGLVVPQMIKGRSVPPIHDITTDTANPPRFPSIANYRTDAVNSLEYGAGFNSPAALAKLQQKAYPGVKSLHTRLAVGEAVDRAREVLKNQGLDVVNVDRKGGTVEAVATSFWFGFKDDVVVRITDAPEGSVVDVRSVSRVGQSDLGVNAKRILEFLDEFNGG